MKQDDGSFYLRVNCVGWVGLTSGGGCCDISGRADRTTGYYYYYYYLKYDYYDWVVYSRGVEGGIWRSGVVASAHFCAP
jgi:hypothetical protein